MSAPSLGRDKATGATIEGRFFSNETELHAAIAEATSSGELKVVFRDATKTRRAIEHIRGCSQCHKALARSREDDVINRGTMTGRFVFSCGEDDMRALAAGVVQPWLASYAQIQVAKFEREQEFARQSSLERHAIVQQHKAAARSPSDVARPAATDGERGVASSEATVDAHPPPRATVDGEPDPAPPGV